MGFRIAFAVADAGARPHAVSANAFRETMRELASGVALVTSATDGKRAGCAVTSLTSLSLAPPSLLVCLNRDSSTLRAIRASGVFAVSMLGVGHEPLARRFSDPGLSGAERFAEGEWLKLETGAPVLSDALAAVDCRLDRIVEHATHAIVIGAAAALAKGGQSGVLLHWRSRFEAMT
jgi:flavin reductase (DIM6/NTAB) family NADH-FMN oxidoreductase RutF